MKCRFILATQWVSLIAFTLLLGGRKALCVTQIPTRTSPNVAVPVIQEGHPWDGSKPVFAISPDKHLIVSASSTRLKLWNDKGELLRNLEGSPYQARPIITPDGKRLLLVGQDRTALYALPSGQKICDLWGAEFSEDARFVIRRTNETLRFSDARTGCPLATVAAHQAGAWPETLNFSPNGRFVAAAQANMSGADGKLRIWDVKTGKLIRLLQDLRGDGGKSTGVVGPVAWSPDGRILVTGGDDPKWKAIPPADGWQGDTAYFHAYVLKVWDVNTGRLLKVWPGYGSNEDSSGIQYFVSNHEVLIGARSINIWTGKSTAKVNFDGTLARDGTVGIVYTDYQHGTFELRDVKSKRVITRFPGSSVAGFKHLAWSTDGMLIAATEENGEVVRIFDSQTTALKRSLWVGGEAIVTLRWLANGILAGTTLQSAWLWSHEGTLLQHFRPPNARQYSGGVGVSPNGQKFISQESVSRVNTVTNHLYVWSAKGELLRDVVSSNSSGTGSRTWEFGFPTALVWVDNTRVAFRSGATVQTLDLVQGTREVLIHALEHNDPFWPFSVSPDGRWLLCRGKQRDENHDQLLLCRIADGNVERVYHDIRVDGIKWDVDSQSFLTASDKIAAQDGKEKSGCKVFSVYQAEPTRILDLPYDEYDNQEVEFSPHFKLMAHRSSTYPATSLSLWNVDTGSVAATLYLFMHPPAHSWRLSRSQLARLLVDPHVGRFL